MASGCGTPPASGVFDLKIDPNEKRLMAPPSSGLLSILSPIAQAVEWLRPAAVNNPG
jgi:hypothetical protein